MPRKEYKSIKIEKHVYDMLRSYARPGETYSSALERLFDTVKTCMLLRERCERTSDGKGKVEVRDEDLDKAAWYIIKIAYSIQTLKMLVASGASKFEIDMQYTRVIRLLEQLKSRYRIDTKLLAEVVTQFMAEPNTDNRVLLNEVLKDLAKTIIRMVVEGRWPG